VGTWQPPEVSPSQPGMAGMELPFHPVTCRRDAVNPLEGQQKGVLQVHQQQNEDRISVGPLLNGNEDLATKDKQKAEVLNATFASVYWEVWPSPVPGPQKQWGKCRARNTYP